MSRDRVTSLLTCFLLSVVQCPSRVVNGHYFTGIDNIRPIALNYNSKQVNRLYVCWNNAYRKILLDECLEIGERTAVIMWAFGCQHIYYLKKVVSNPVLKACCDRPMFSHSVEFTLMCCSFDTALDLCSEVDIRSKVFSASITLFI